MESAVDKLLHLFVECSLTHKAKEVRGYIISASSPLFCVSVCFFVRETDLPTGASKHITKGTSGTSGMHAFCNIQYLPLWFLILLLD